MRAESIWTPADLVNPAVSLSDMKLHLREDGSDQDTVISAQLLAATRAVEIYTQRIIVRRECVLRARYLPCGRNGLRLPGGHVHAVTAMTVEGAAFTAFEVIGHSPAILVPDEDWATITEEGFPISVTYTAGPASAPADLAAAVKLIAAELYERRANGSEMSLQQVPMSAQALMAPHRIMPR